MTDIRNSIEGFWTKSSMKVVWKPSVEFTDCTVAASDLADVSSAVIAVSFVGCRSKEWVEIGEQLVTLA
jgi:hypothetical protein